MTSERASDDDEDDDDVSKLRLAETPDAGERVSDDDDMSELGLVETPDAGERVSERASKKMTKATKKTSDDDDVLN